MHVSQTGHLDALGIDLRAGVTVLGEKLCRVGTALTVFGYWGAMQKIKGLRRKKREDTRYLAQ